ncbi:pilus assembly protein FimV [Oryzisolibacter propanilivorax]|uniref:Pilus assembly protein FimV n=1 Tax=Oryzisolibacter propanilivorax TaxID=1527607 RepID=A0A1G9R681_9BURK|nr:FimV/HubP family polar landmark protein [Oryzisolibacter propanilivorax]SDM17935.1 pilus assembly protein FimV [Oryzisolibacter propanilivorax]
MHRWNRLALASAAVLSASLYATDASALALGRLNIQSALGEPLRAEIDLPQITPAEAESLRVGLASPDVFRSQGAEYSSTAHSVQMQLQRRADGSMVLRLSSPRPINDPFVDLVVDANWNAGRVVRSYTLLLDPPALRRPPVAVAAAPQTQATPAPRSEPPAAAPARAPIAPRARPAPAVRAAEAQPATRGEVTVRSGDTAGRIAAANRPGGVSLDQMLVAMMRANPEAFIQGNVNRLRAGSVLQLPDAAEAQATPAAEARRIVAAQSRDFNEFRRRMAESAPATQQAAADRSASGKVQTQVEDRKASATRPDQLTLSKGSISASAADEQLARGRQSGEDAARMAELSRNISELNQLGAGAAAPTGTPAAAPAAAPGTLAVPAPAGVPATPDAAAPTSGDAPATSAPAAPTPASAQPPAARPKPATPPAPMDIEEPSFFDALTGDPLLAGGALALVLALIGYGSWRVVQRRREQNAADSSFMETRRPPDSFFGVSGGQRVDTAGSELTTGSSSMHYSPSQLDAGDVDPVAEADVYLAYGRDLQAEEILKEAQRHQPERVSIPAKLAEIYAKRQDRRALEASANDVLRMTGGRGPEWARVAELGRTLDPANPLYQPGTSPVAPAGAAGLAGAVAGVAAAGAATAADAASAAAEPEPSKLPDLDLDLDFDLDLQEAPPAPAAPGAFAAAAAAAQGQTAPDREPLPAAIPPAPAAPSAGAEPDTMPGLDFALGDLDLPGGAWEASHLPQAAVPTQPPVPEVDLPTEPSPFDLEDAGLTFEESAPAPLTADEPRPSAPAPLEFDLGDLSLDLGDSGRSGTATSATVTDELADTALVPDDALPDDPLATKLALAEEFDAIGDSEGARALVEEVIAEASGDVRSRAQRLLAKLG